MLLVLLALGVSAVASPPKSTDTSVPGLSNPAGHLYSLVSWSCGGVGPPYMS